MLRPLIMAGGSGTRFWPRSRHHRPKQLIDIVGQGTMIQQTVARLRTDLPAESFLVMTNRVQADAVREQLPELQASQVVAEPRGRDTSACIGLAACIMKQSDPDAIMVVCSADHVIRPPDEFMRCIREAARIAVNQHVLTTMGIRPSSPSELYGYIRRGDPLAGSEGGAIKAFRLREFKEKPSRKQAEAFLASGEYYWNSGNFVWHVDDILSAIRTHLPEMAAGLDRIAPALGTPEQDAVIEREFPKLPRISIDYGVMEKADNAVVVETSFEWDDVGSWDAVARHHPADADDNVILAKHVGKDTKGCILAAENGHLLATLGVRDLIVVHTPDATLVCDRDRASDVKALVEALKNQGLNEHL